MTAPAPPFDVEQLYEAQSAVGEGVALLSGETVVFANAAVQRLTGRDLPELLRLSSFTRLVPPSQRAVVRRAIRRARHGMVQVTVETHFERGDGHRVDVECAMCAAGRSPGGEVFVFARELGNPERSKVERLRISAERAARDAAERARNRAAFLAEASQLLANAIVDEGVLDRLARLVVKQSVDWCTIEVIEGSSNDGRDLLLRRVASAHIDEPSRSLDDCLRDSSPDIWDPAGLGDVVRSGEVRVVIDAAVQLANGIRTASDETFLRLLVTLGLRSAIVVPLVARGRVMGALAVARGSGSCDADDLVMFESLAHRVAVALDNERLYENQREAVRARDDFVAVAAHELRTPVSALLLQLEALASACGDEPCDPPPSQAGVSWTDKLHAAHRQARRLVRLVNNMFDMARIHSGKLRLRPVATDLDEVAREVVERHQLEASRAGCELSLKCPRGVRGLWDRASLEQILTNLLSNAIKYGAGNPVDIRVEAGPQGALLIVQDRGVGIDGLQRDHIFECFSRATSQHAAGGLGVGLYITRQLVEAHAGTIAVTSTPAAGARFVVALPYEGPPPSSQRAER